MDPEQIRALLESFRNANDAISPLFIQDYFVQLANLTPKIDGIGLVGTWETLAQGKTFDQFTQPIINFLKSVNLDFHDVLGDHVITQREAIEALAHAGAYNVEIPQIGFLNPINPSTITPATHAEAYADAQRLLESVGITPDSHESLSNAEIPVTYETVLNGLATAEVRAQGHLQQLIAEGEALLEQAQ